MFITNFSISVTRACTMGIIGMIAKLSYKKLDFLTSISLSLLITLFINPFLLIDIGLQLSYLGTIGIVLFNKPIQNLLQKRFPKKILKILSVSIAAQITIIPIIAYRFNSFSLIFPISNICATPIIGIIIILGFVILFLSFLSFKLAKLFAIVLNILIKTLKLIANSVSKIPYGTLTIVTPYVLTIITLYLLIFLFNYIYNIYYPKKNLKKYEKKIKELINKKNICHFIVIVMLVIILLNICIYVYKIKQGIL